MARADDGALEEVFFDFVYQPMLDADGTIDRILVMANDVTESVLSRRLVGAAGKAAEAER